MSACTRQTSISQKSIEMPSGENTMSISAEHCKMMPDMLGCEIYIQNESTWLSNIHDGHGWHMDHASMVTDVLSFVAEMIPHHQEAVDTSTFVLSQTSNTKLKPLLQNIIDTQQKEIAMMKWWLMQYFSGEQYTPSYMLMMRPLQNLTGNALDTVYMQDMILHHKGALDMANKILSVMNDEDPNIRLTQEMANFRTQIRQFAQDIITTQTQEIQLFEQLLQ
jgi:uncharacterized protein (DUF305 family)